MIEEAGGRIVGSVSTKTSFVVMGADPGQKAQDAMALGIRIIEEAELIKMVSETHNVETTVENNGI